MVVAAGDQAAATFGNLPDINWPLFSAMGAFFAPLYVVPIALLCSPFMAAHGTRKGAVAVQCVGCSWVLGAVFVFLYLALGSVVYVAGNVFFDAIGFAYTVPTTFTETFNGTVVCGGLVQNGLTIDEVVQLDLSTAKGAMCLVVGAALNGCWSGGSIVGATLSVLQAPFTLPELKESLQIKIDELDRGDLFNTSATQLVKIYIYV